MKTRKIVGYVILSICSLPFLYGFYDLLTNLSWYLLIGILSVIGLAVLSILGLYLIREDIEK